MTDPADGGAAAGPAPSGYPEFAELFEAEAGGRAARRPGTRLAHSDFLIERYLPLADATELAQR